jgi:hypothetical protein
MAAGMITNCQSKGATIATLALAGLLAGIAACATTATNEVVVEPPPPANTAAPEATAAVDDPPPEEEADPQPRKARHKKLAATPGMASNCCKAKNECKGKGGCKTDANECKGQNECKHKGGCKVGDCDPDELQDATPGGVVGGSAGVRAPSPPQAVPGSASNSGKMCCRGQNDCKGKGGCKTVNHDCKGKNDCKGNGGCRGPC